MFLQEDKSNKNQIAAISSKIIFFLHRGENFSNAISRLNFFFPEIFINFLSKADEIGNIQKLLMHVKKYFENKINLREKIFNALIYPFTIFALTIILLIFSYFFLLPKFSELFRSFGGTSVEKFNLLIFDIKKTFLFMLSFLLILFMTIFVIFKYQKKNLKLKQKLNLFFISIPNINKIILANNLYNFSYSMEILSLSGLSIEKSLEKSLSVINNIFLKDKIEMVSKNIKKGKSVYVAFKEQKNFPCIFLDYLYIGEKSGNIKNTFCNIRKYYEKFIKQFFAKISIIIEPLTMIFLGLVMSIIVLKIVVPIFNIYGSLVL